ncbi:fumarylacetoacetate hydrolase family protein [Paenibacillus arenilitoris]|uniref:Fumarylacetoacetate hydrolase family protein n=1 Tax=Paenibacillus arenilitoris TaxID=2772299 RepID=A0A927H3V4_9BACL|nr:fumarylacetoacetate hydrolase family protein [Paenibacillus arenilitoris]MBD2867260.1 fumarylacetoacetate hydrolase family protein [Paenibacillus arenilitoris]
MRIFRYKEDSRLYLGAITESGEAYRLDAPDLMTLVHAARAAGLSTAAYVTALAGGLAPIEAPAEALNLATPLDAPEVWAAGVTYQRSREARNYEATEGRLDADTFYDKVYEAERPELFMKSTAARTVGPGEPVCLRSDSSWQVPEAELGLVLDRAGAIVGYTAGNDMSCRDIEGENPLYLPQAKIWKRSCSIGPYVRLAETVDDPYALAIACRIYRDGVKVVDETANTGQLKRKLEELVAFLKRDNELFDGTVLLTGTCLVPPNQFTLASGDRIEIEIEGIGTLTNTAIGTHELESAQAPLRV